MNEQGNAIPGIDRLKDEGIVRDRNDAQPRHGDEPDDHHRTEHPADASRSEPLQHEQADQNDQRERQNRLFQPVAFDTQTFDGAEHRNGRREHAIAVEECESGQ